MIQSYGFATADALADTADLEADTQDIDTSDIEATEEVTEDLPRLVEGPKDEQRILDLLEECTGGLTIDAIVEELELSRTWVWNLLEQLAAAGVVRRMKDHMGPRQIVYLWFLA